jgi:hypothetical protein
MLDYLLDLLYLTAAGLIVVYTFHAPKKHLQQMAGPTPQDFNMAKNFHVSIHLLFIFLVS